MARFLMHCNDIVARSDTGHLGDWKILIPRLLPVWLKGKLQEVPEHLGEDVQTIPPPVLPESSVPDEQINEDYIQSLIADGNNAEAVRLLRRAQEVANYEKARADYEKSQAQSAQERGALISDFKNKQANVLMTWMSERTLPVGRANFKRICNQLNLDAPQLGIYARAQISELMSAQSITDNYWLTGDSVSPPSWDKVLWRKASLRRGVSVVALTGDASFMTPQDYNEELGLIRSSEKSGISPENNGLKNTAEAMLLGSYSKAIFREDDGSLWLYKTDEISNFTVFAEVAVSRILDCTNVTHLNYVLAEEKTVAKLINPNSRFDRRVVKCKLMTTDDYEIIHSIEIDPADMRNYINQYNREYSQMVVVDYLVGNHDRHGYNWGVQREASANWEVTGFHPLYDHNESFRKYEEHFIGESKIFPQHTLESAAVLCYPRSDFRFTKPIPYKTTFALFGRNLGAAMRNEFELRCKKLNIPVKIV